LDLKLNKPRERTMSYSLYGASFVRIFAISENRAQNDKVDVLSFGTSFIDGSKFTTEKIGY
jgi:hypothetical protein